MDHLRPRRVNLPREPGLRRRTQSQHPLPSITKSVIAWDQRKTARIPETQATTPLANRRQHTRAWERACLKRAPNTSIAKTSLAEKRSIWAQIAATTMHSVHAVDRPNSRCTCVNGAAHCEEGDIQTQPCRIQRAREDQLRILTLVFYLCVS